MLVRTREAAKTQAELERVNPRIQIGKRGVGNVHEAKLGAPIVFAFKKVQAQRAARREIYARSAGRHVVIREERAASEFEIGNDLAGLCKIPFQREGIQSEAISGAATLNYHEHGHHIHRVFELPAQKAWAVRRGQNPAITCTDVPHAAVGGSSIQSVSAAGPEL